jgi:hypothetical protein
MLAGVTLFFAGSTAESSAVSAHILASFVTFFAAIGMQLLVWGALRAGGRTSWRQYSTYSLVSGILTFVMLIIFSYLSDVYVYHGLIERLLIAVPWIWIEVSSLKILSVSSRGKQLESERGVLLCKAVLAGGNWRPKFDPKTVHRELQIIREDLHYSLERRTSGVGTGRRSPGGCAPESLSTARA